MMKQETAPLMTSPQANNSTTPSKSGTILEGAFVDPAYSWPPEEGVGTNALELFNTKTPNSKKNSNDEDLMYPEVPIVTNKRKVITETEVVTTGRCFGGLFKCCRSDEAVLNTSSETIHINPEEKERVKKEYLRKREKVKKKRKERKEMQKQMRKKQSEEIKKYTIVPEGVLVYRLDTAQKTISLISAPNSDTNMNELMTEMIVVDAVPSSALNRKGIMITGDDGDVVEIVACEQRTATAWMEALNMMLGKDRHGMKKVRYSLFFHLISTLIKTIHI